MQRILPRNFKTIDHLQASLCSWSQTVQMYLQADKHRIEQKSSEFYLTRALKKL